MNDKVILQRDVEQLLEKEVWLSDSTKAALRNVLCRAPAVAAREQIYVELCMTHDLGEEAAVRERLLEDLLACVRELARSETFWKSVPVRGKVMTSCRLDMPYMENVPDICVGHKEEE